MTAQENPDPAVYPDDPDLDQLDEGPPAPADRDWPRPWQPAFLRSLSLLPDVTAACRIARITRAGAYKARSLHPDFAAAWDEALDAARDFIQRQLHSWATTGVPIETVRTRVKEDGDGNVIERETTTTRTTERSVAAMIFWMKSWYPDRYGRADGRVADPDEAQRRRLSQDEEDAIAAAFDAKVVSLSAARASRDAG